MYPKRGDQNPKRLAYEQYAKRLKEGVPHDEMKEGLERYILYCEMKGITGTPFVMMAQTFFGPHERWADEFNYTPPEGEGGVFWGGS